LRVPKIKPLEEILRMDKEQLLNYLMESEISVLPTDSVAVVPFPHGTKILFYHKNQDRPYKIRVYLTRIEDVELLK
jgi:hypothetical protein